MKTNAEILISAVIFITLVVAGCTMQPSLTREQVFNEYPDIQRLDGALQKAKSDDAQLLAPAGYNSGERLLERAIVQAKNDNRTEAEAAARQGLSTVEALNRNMAASRDLLAEVLQARQRAYAAGAGTLSGNRLAEADDALRDAAAMIENGLLEQAKQSRPDLVSRYSQMELASLKQSTLDRARAAVNDAIQHGAKKYAPRTLGDAEKEIELAVSILEADRAQTEKANQHSNRARKLAQRSAAITETVRDFDRRNYSMEDVVLWHQRQLSVINEPLGGELPFNEPSDEVVLVLREKVNRIQNENRMARHELRLAEQKLMERQSTITTMTQEEKAEREKFAQVQALFTEAEANVYRQRQNLIISVHGFDFPSGQSEIRTNNFPLMNKIIRAINVFPSARVEVTGHTDALGDDALNQRLSENRAEKVAKFIIEVGGIDPGLISHQGFGKTRPVASNETREGRAENRRVEIRIINE